MRMRKIGTTDIEASVVALGAWAMVAAHGGENLMISSQLVPSMPH